MNAIQYVKNIGKSLGYASIDALKDTNPAVTSMASSAKELTTDLYQSIKDFNSKVSARASESEKSLSGEAKDFVGTMWQNVRSDLLSGNLYNKQRIKEADEAMLKDMFGDMDFDFDGDDFGDFDFDDDMGKSNDPIKAEISQDVQNTKAIVTSMDVTASKLSGAVNTTTVKSAEYIVAAQERASRALYDLNSRGFSNINTGLAALNSHMGIMSSLAEPLNTHMQNSVNFYTKSSEFQQKTLEMLGKIVENTTPTSEKSNRRGKTSGVFIEDLMSGGTIDMRAYKDMVMQNIASYTDMVSSMFSMMGGAKGASRELTKNPLGWALTQGIKAAAPKMMKKAMDDFNGMIEGALYTFLGQLRDAKPGGVLGLIKDLFVPQSAYSGNKISLKIREGKVDFDGQAHYALTRAIPDQLATIIGLLSGTEARYIDYKTGKYKTLSKIKTDFKNVAKQHAQSANMDFRYSSRQVLNGLERGGSISGKQKESMMNEIDAFLEIATTSGNTEFLKFMENNFDYKKFGMSKASWDFLRAFIKSNEKNGNRSLRTNMTGGVISGREKLGNALKGMNANGNDVSALQFNEFLNDVDTNKAARLLGKDKDGNDIFFYLRGIYDRLGGGTSPSGGTSGSTKTKKSSAKEKVNKATSESKTAAIKEKEIDDAVKAINDSALSINAELEEYIEKKSKFMGSDDEWKDSDDYDENLERQIGVRNALFKIKGGLSKSTIGQKVISFFDSISNVLDRSASGITKLFTKMAEGITNELYGENGIIRTLFTNPKEGLKRIGREIWDSKIGKNIKNAGGWVRNAISESLFGRTEQLPEGYSRAKDGSYRYKGQFMSDEQIAKMMAAEGYKGSKTGFVEFMSNIMHNNGKASRGRKVTKSGVVIVSEGELIIPAELNPFYHGRVDKRAQDRNEKSIEARYFGRFKNGGTAKSRESETKGSKKKSDSKSKNDDSDGSDAEHSSFTEDLFNEAKRTINQGVSLFKDVLFKGAESASGWFNSLFPTDPNKEQKLMSERIKDAIKSFDKDTAGAAGAGAIIGAGVSILSGGVLGPILGASLGAATGIVLKSKKVQEVLFGDFEYDEKDKRMHRAGGMLSKEVSQFLTEKVPGIAKGTVVGGAAGLFLGSPVMGAVLGGVGSFIAQSERAKSVLFGNMEFDKDDKPIGRDGGIISKQLQEDIKKRAPGIAKGALAGLGTSVLFGSPFGVVGSMLIGAGAGFLGTSSKFQTWMFGDGKDDKGFVGILSEKIFGHVDTIFHNIANRLKIHAKTFIDRALGLTKNLFKKLEERYTSGKGGLLTNLIGGTVKLGGKVVKGTTNFVGNRLGDIARNTTNYNIKHGFGAYNSVKKRMMSAQDRLNYQKMQGIGSDYDNYYSYLAGLTGDEARETYSALDLYSRGKSNLTEAELLKKYGLEKSGINLNNKKDINKLMDLAKNESKVKQKMTTEEKTENFRTRLMKRLDAIIDRLTPGYEERMLEESWMNIGGDGSDDYSSTSGESGPGVQTYRPKFRQRVKNKIRNAAKSASDKAKNYFARAEEGDTKEIKGKTYIWKGGKWVSKEEDELDTSYKRAIIKHVPLIATFGTVMGNLFSKAKEALFGKDGDEKSKGLLGGLFEKMFGSDSLLGGVIAGFFGEKSLKAVITKGATNLLKGMLNALSDVAIFALSWDALTGKFDNSALAKWLGFGGGNKDNEGETLIQKLKKALFPGSDDDNKDEGATGPESLGNSNGAVHTNLRDRGYSSSIGGYIPRGQTYSKATKGIGSHHVTATSKLPGLGNISEVYINDETGEYTDSMGVPVITSSIQDKRTDTDPLSVRLAKNAVRGTLTGKGSVLGFALGKTKIGRAVGNGVKKFASGLGTNFAYSINKGGRFVDASTKKFAKTAAVREGAMEHLGMDNLYSGLKKIASGLKKVPILKKVGSRLDDMVDDIAEKIAAKLATGAGKKLADMLATAVVWLKIAMIVVDFTTGYEDAATTMKVKNPTPMMKIAGGLLRVFKNCIPIIGSFIPDELLVDIFVKYIAPVLGFDIESFKEMRAEADAELAEYNETHDTNMDWSEYNKTVREDYTWTERYGNGFRASWAQSKAKVANAKRGIQEKGFGGYTKQLVSDYVTGFKESYESNGGGVDGVFSGIADTFKNMLPGIFGNIASCTADIWKYAVKGEIGNLWKVSLPEFSQGETGADGVEKAVPGIFSKIFGQIPLFFTKLPATLVGGIMAVVHPVIDFIGNTIDKIKNSFSGVGSSISEMFGMVKEGKVSELISHGTGSDKSEDSDNPMGFMAGLTTNIVKPFLVVPAGVSYIGHKIAEFVGNMTDKIKKAADLFSQQEQIGEQLLYDKDSSLKDFFTVEDDEGNPVGGIFKAILIGQRLTAIPTILLRRAGNAIRDRFNAIVSTVVKSASAINTNYQKIQELAYKGDISGIWANEVEEDEENPINGVMGAVNFFQKLGNTPIAAFHIAGKWLREAFNSVRDGAIKSFESVNTNYQKIQELAYKGDISGIWANEVEEDEENPINGVMGAVNFFQKLGNTPIAVYKWAIDGVRETFATISTAISKDHTKFTSTIDKLRELSAYAGEDDAKLGEKVRSIWNMETKFDNDNPISGLFSAGIGVSKIWYTLVAMVNEIAGPIGEAISSVRKKIGAKWDAAKEWTSEKVDAAKTTVSNAYNSAKEGVYNVANSAWQGAKHLVTGRGSGLAGGGFVSQRDSRYSKMGIGQTSVGEMGCGPAAAVMALNQHSSNMANAVGLANRYQTAGGTDAAFFSDYYARSGRRARYLNNGSSAGRAGIINNIASGQPTILMGRDTSNNSKARSPFGPNNHYVVASGFDRSGNIIVKDPELRGTRKYPASILRNASVGISAGGTLDDFEYQQKMANKGKNATERGFSSSTAGFGKGYNSTPHTQNAYPDLTGIAANPAAQSIFAFLKDHGFSDAGAVGLMGCWQAESKNDPRRVEADYLKGFPGFDAIADSAEIRNQWAETIKARTHTANVRLERYLGQDGNYYPGFGLAQWTGPRGYNLLNWSRENGYDWKQLDPQLKFAMSELEGKYSGVYEGLKTAEDPVAATQLAYTKYEGGPKSKTDWLNTRIGYAQEFFNQFTGKSFNYNPSAIASNVVSSGGIGGFASSSSSGTSTGGVGGETTGTGESSENSSGSSMGMLGAITAAFGKIGEFLGGGLNKDKGSETGTNLRDRGYSSSMDGYNGATYSSSSSASSGGDYEKVHDVTTRADAKEKQQALVKKMQSIAGTLAYSQSGPRNPDKGSADCSSTVNWAYKKVMNSDIGNSTPAIMSNTGNLVTIDKSDLPRSGGTGSGPNLSKLEPGDLVLLSRPTSGFSSGRPYRVGHVEMYMGNGRTIGHGKSGGPREREIERDKYIMSKRFVDFIEEGKTLSQTGANGMPSRVAATMSTKSSKSRPKTLKDTGANGMPSGVAATMSGGESGLLGGMASRFVQAALSQKGYTEVPDNMTPFGKFTGFQGQPWCASFVSWAMNKAFNGNAAKASKALYGGPTAAVQTLWDRFQANGAMHDTPEVGDVVIYKNGTSHTGIVQSVNGNTVTTIEGNTSGDESFDRNGGMVWSKTFDYTKNPRLTGFGRPNWEGIQENRGFADSTVIDNSGQKSLDNGFALASGRLRAEKASESSDVSIQNNSNNSFDGLSGMLASADSNVSASGSGLLPMGISAGESGLSMLGSMLRGTDSSLANIINLIKELLKNTSAIASIADILPVIADKVGAGDQDITKAIASLADAQFKQAYDKSVETTMSNLQYNAKEKMAL